MRVMRKLYNIRACLATGLTCLSGILFAAGIALPAASGDDAPLEPSIQNEVDHAIFLGEKWLEDFRRTNAVGSVSGSATATNGAPACARAADCADFDLFATNKLDREGIALRLVRSQRAGGFWTDPRGQSATNRVTVQSATRLAVSILSSL